MLNFYYRQDCKTYMQQAYNNSSLLLCVCFIYILFYSSCLYNILGGADQSETSGNKACTWLRAGRASQGHGGWANTLRDRGEWWQVMACAMFDVFYFQLVVLTRLSNYVNLSMALGRKIFHKIINNSNITIHNM